MEKKLVKVYSNNSKSARLKRRKNKFQRVWNAEKQEYVKTRKPKFAISSKKVKKTEKSVEEQVKAAYARAERKTKATKKSIHINTQAKKKPVTHTVHAKVDVVPYSNIITLCGKKMAWNQEKLMYCEAAQY